MLASSGRKIVEVQFPKQIIPWMPCGLLQVTKQGYRLLPKVCVHLLEVTSAVFWDSAIEGTWEEGLSTKWKHVWSAHFCQVLIQAKALNGLLSEKTGVRVCNRKTAPLEVFHSTRCFMSQSISWCKLERKSWRLALASLIEKQPFHEAVDHKAKHLQWQDCKALRQYEVKQGISGIQLDIHAFAFTIHKKCLSVGDYFFFWSISFTSN